MAPGRIAIALALVAILAGASEPGGLGESGLTAEAAAWLASLDAEQRDAALYAFDDAERFDLRLAPFLLEGLRRNRMSDAQWAGWRRVLATTLSTEGLRKVETIVSLEREVRQRDRQRWLSSWFGAFIHGEDRYYVALFGEPAADRAWGLRFDGHHVSLNWTIAADGTVSTTPVFLGAEPREVPAGWERAGLRALAEEEDAGQALWRALDPDQRARGELAFQPASGLAGRNRPQFVGEGERLELDEPTGISRGELAARQRALLDDLVQTYLAHLAAPLRDARRAALDAAGRDSLHFAWAGDLTPGEAGYYRVQGPTLLIEFDNTLPEADHVHTIVRQPNGDFGRDLLAEHYAQHHRRREARTAAPPASGPRP